MKTKEELLDDLREELKETRFRFACFFGAFETLLNKLKKEDDRNNK